MISFRVYGTPKPQPRLKASAFSAGGKTRATLLNPGTAEAWKVEIFAAAREFLPESPIGGPVAVLLEILLPRPKAWEERKRPHADDGEIFYPKCGDVDNYAKAVLDCLTSVRMWGDDRQVVDLRVRKMIHRKGGRPGARIEITRAAS